MLVIRLTRRGRRNDPSFRLVVTEHANPVRGKFLEELGHLDPVTKNKSFEKERILHWISQGAKCSATVNNLLVSEGIIQGTKVKAWRAKPRAEKKEGGPPAGETRPEGGKEAEKSEARLEAASEKEPEKEASLEPGPAGETDKSQEKPAEETKQEPSVEIEEKSAE